MIVPGAASLPQPGGIHRRGELPELYELREALRPPDLPLPAPTGVLEAAHRVSDLVHAERYREAHALVETFGARDAPPADRIALLRAGLTGVSLTGDPEGFERTAAEMITLLRTAGHHAQADATTTVLIQRDQRSHRPRGAAVKAAATSPPVPRGRRRGARAEAPVELVAVVQGLELVALQDSADPSRAGLDPAWAARRLRAALQALPTVHEQVLGDPEPLLRARLAQALEGAGDTVGATTQALDVLELIEQREVEQQAPIADPQRVATSAHAVLARTLGTQYPLQAISHALDALGALHDIDDPPLRVGLITDLLQALMSAGATPQASFTAGRLLSLQRTLRRDSLRTAPLLAVATQRLHAERYDAARVPLEQARAIARDQRDRYATLEAARLAASIHDRTANHRAALVELQLMAADARWLADDLATPAPQRAVLVRTELEAQAMVMRRALDLGETALAQSAAQAVERRTRPEGGRPLLPAQLLWDHRVDARVGRFIAVGAALGRGEDGVSRSDYDHRRQEAMLAIDEVPAGHDARARYWAAYIDDRHADMLAADGKTVRALRAARRAREGWLHLEMSEDVVRLDALIARLEAE